MKCTIVSAVIALCSFSPATPALADTLVDAIYSAVSNSEARNAAIAGIQAQGRMINVAQGDKRAQVNVFGSAAAEWVEDPTLTPADNRSTKFARIIGVDVSVNLLDGMRTMNRIYREATLLDAEIIRLSDATETLALNAVQAYIDVIRHRNIVQASRRNVARHAEISRQVVSQVDAGKLSDADRFRANDKLLAAQLALADAEAQLGDANSQFELIIGKAPTTTMSRQFHTHPPASREAVETAAVTNSFQMQLAANEIQAQTYQGAMDEADWKPKIDAFIGADIGANQEGATGTDSTVAAGVRLNWTLYKGNTREATRARNRDLVIRGHYRKKQIENEVRDFARRAWNAYHSARERKMLLDRSVSTNELIVDAFRQEFEAAKRPLLQVLDAERALFNLRIRQINASAAYYYQGYRVLAAQSKLSEHFGLTKEGRVLNADFETRVKANPMGGFNISAPALD
ncbi:TolC family protein [Shimia sp. R10_1]|uniref:TolC family protein n=1 Tax=Shimia sp. R10_1 TaxID=2821095 RepID=UPI001ADAC08A|nr:TolC family protein [Shimia sp. R10_1]MBO9475523.1 TolC family protein [Shimia sp. R10_1]